MILALVTLDGLLFLCGRFRDVHTRIYNVVVPLAIILLGVFAVDLLLSGLTGLELHASLAR